MTLGIELVVSPAIVGASPRFVGHVADSFVGAEGWPVRGVRRTGCCCKNAVVN